MENHNATDPKDPASFLSSIIGVPVTVKLNSGIVYKGELQSVDGYMNIALEKCAEYVNGQLRRDYGDAFVRGNNGACSMFLPRMTQENFCASLISVVGGSMTDNAIGCSALHFKRLRRPSRWAK